MIENGVSRVRWKTAAVLAGFIFALPTNGQANSPLPSPALYVVTIGADNVKFDDVGRAVLDQVAVHYRAIDVNSVCVTGYDWSGSADPLIKSREAAELAANYLRQAGVPPLAITTVGKGDGDPSTPFDTGKRPHALLEVWIGPAGMGSPCD